jgi:hypothetical protein
VDENLLLRIRKLKADPVRKRTRYGSMSDLLNTLLLQWVMEQETTTPNHTTKEVPHE